MKLFPFQIFSSTKRTLLSATHNLILAIFHWKWIWISVFGHFFPLGEKIFFVIFLTLTIGSKCNVRFVVVWKFLVLNHFNIKTKNQNTFSCDGIDLIKELKILMNTEKYWTTHQKILPLHLHARKPQKFFCLLRRRSAVRLPERTLKSKLCWENCVEVLGPFYKNCWRRSLLFPVAYRSLLHFLKLEGV